MLTQNSTGYTLVRRDGGTERYDTSGLFVDETDPSGKITNYFYGTDSKLDRVTDPFGHILTFGYDANNRVATVTDTADKIIYYDYDNTFPTLMPATPLGNLTRVRYPDNTAKIYYYEDANNPHGLTGIAFVDTSGTATRFATYAYYSNSSNPIDLSNGKAITTQHAPTDNGFAQERFTLAYNTDTQTTVTDPVNTQEVMIFLVNLGVKNLTSKVNQSDSKSVQQVFDTNNNLTCRKDEENRVTLHGYNATNQRTSMTEGLSGTDCNVCLGNPTTCNAGGVGRTTTYQYLSSALDLPRFLRRPSVAAGKIFETEIQYNDAGHPHLPTDIIQRGFTPTNTAVTRTVTLGYNAMGQINAINGPRSPSDPGMNGLDDLTTLEYYNCDTGGRCGQLMKVTNALGHVTTYDLYDLNGRVTQLTDPNGLVTVYEYDPVAEYGLSAKPRPGARRG